MCGIIGMLNFNSAPDAVAVAAGLRTLRHRGPDAHALWSSPDRFVVLGHSRLKILDLSPAAAQPMVSPATGCALTYNGEIYNFADLRSRLRHQGIAVRSTGDTEVLLRWLEWRGADGLAELEGMYALGFWDPHARRLLLARDPMGIKPLYWCSAGGQLLFASELRALLATGLIPARIFPPALRGFLAFGAVQGPETLVEGVRELSPGQYLEFTPGHEPRRKTFWRPKYPGREAQPLPLSSQELLQLLTQAVAGQSVSDVPLGAFLSGGLDSSLCAALLARQTSQAHTLSVVFPDAPALDEARFSRQVAERIGTRHSEIPMTVADALPTTAAALAAQDQPSVDGLNTFVISRAARQAGLTVALSGLGADELFAGYSVFSRLPALTRRMQRGGACGRGLLLTAAAASNRLLPYSRLAGKLDILARAQPSLPGLYRCSRGLFSPRLLDRLLPYPPVESPPLIEMDGWAPADSISWLEMRGYMANMLLRDTDAMSMAVSLEVRVPYLHLPLVNVAQAAGPALRRRRPYPKQALIDAAGGLLPPEVWTRPKQGFGFPLQAWLLGPLRPQAEAALLDPAAPIARCLRPRETVRLWRAFQAAPARVGWSRVWALIVLNSWLSVCNVNLSLC